MRGTVLGVLAVLALILVFSGAFVVQEGQQVIVTQFGRPVGGAITRAGLHFKLPLIQDVRTFEKRLLEWDGDPNQIPTRDKKFIHVDTTARWRITDPLLFLQTVQDEIGAMGRLDAVLDAAVRDEISRHNLIDAVRTSNRPLTVEEELGSAMEREVGESVEIGREGIIEAVLSRAREEVKKYGIELVDLRIKTINYVEEVRRKVYDRMISERKKIAERYRSEGVGKAAEFDGQREKELLRVRSEAYRKAQEIRGEAEAEAAKIYAEAYGQDPEFFRFLESLAAYEETLGGDTLLLLSSGSDFLRYLGSAGDAGPAAAADSGGGGE